MELKDVLVRPLITEKTTTFLGNDRTFAFEVGLAANKIQIKNAIQVYYDVGVENVRTIVMRGKTKRFGRKFGKRKNWKKAYITLREGDTIPIFEG
jgi:large subunit ribosomal protein L23